MAILKNVRHLGFSMSNRVNLKSDLYTITMPNFMLVSPFARFSWNFICPTIDNRPLGLYYSPTCTCSHTHYVGLGLYRPRQLGLLKGGLVLELGGRGALDSGVDRGGSRRGSLGGHTLVGGGGGTHTSW